MTAPADGPPVKGSCTAGEMAAPHSGHGSGVAPLMVADAEQAAAALAAGTEPAWRVATDEEREYLEWLARGGSA